MNTPRVYMVVIPVLVAIYAMMWAVRVSADPAKAYMVWLFLAVSAVNLATAVATVVWPGGRRPAPRAADRE